MSADPLPAGSAQRLQRLLREHDIDTAEVQVSATLAQLLGQPVADLQFTLDAYSLNSVSGTFATASGEESFFKFHTEEGEEATVGEYYRAELLAEAGLPVDLPVAHSSEPGAQVVVYRRRHELRMGDVCLAIERTDGANARLPTELLNAQRRLDERTGQVLLESLRPPTRASAGISLHQLFHTRLVDAGVFPGGRYAKWYLDSPEFGNVADLEWEIDGVRHGGSLRQLGDRMAGDLAPLRLAQLPVVTAHGDDHQGNIWVVSGKDGVTLSLFDPAFASAQIPALLAPIKATYHNVFAHPFWLYHPQEAEPPESDLVDGRLVLRSRGGVLSPLRLALLSSLTEHVWVPLLAQLQSRRLLPEDWQQTVRSAMAACPLLVTDLLAPTRPEPVRRLGLARVVEAGLPGDAPTDPVGRWLAGLSAAIK